LFYKGGELLDLLVHMILILFTPLVFA